jgi:hypothetical protein
VCKTLLAIGEMMQAERQFDYILDVFITMAAKKDVKCRPSSSQMVHLFAALEHIDYHTNHLLFAEIRLMDNPFIFIVSMRIDEKCAFELAAEETLKIYVQFIEI